MNVHIFHHTPGELTGNIDPWLAARSANVTQTRFYERTFFPALRGLDLVVVMGGALSVNDHERNPWLSEEKRFLRGAIERGVPTFGVCLGSQLIACALGSNVYPNAHPEHGWIPIEGLSHDGCFQFPARFSAFEAHGDTFDLPDGAVHLARSAGCHNQAFQYHEHVIALQFHLETTRESGNALITECAGDWATGPYVQSTEEMLSADAELYAQSETLMNGVLDHLTVRNEDRGARTGERETRSEERGKRIEK